MNKLKEGQRIGVYEVLVDFCECNKGNSYLGKEFTDGINIYFGNDSKMLVPMFLTEVRKVATLIVKRVK